MERGSSLMHPILHSNHFIGEGTHNDELWIYRVSWKYRRYANKVVTETSDRQYLFDHGGKRTTSNFQNTTKLTHNCWYSLFFSLRSYNPKLIQSKYQQPWPLLRQQIWTAWMTSSDPQSRCFATKDGELKTMVSLRIELFFRNEILIVILTPFCRRFAL